MADSPQERLGTLEYADSHWTVRFVRRLPHPPERVWQALTEPDELAAWFPTSIEGERRAGAPLVFAFAGGQAPAFDGVMLTYDPPRVLEFVWGTERLRFELRAADSGTELTLLNVLDDRGTGARTAAGWHVCLDSLEQRLKDAAEPPQGSWDAVHSLYVRSFGPEAATIGVPPGLG